MFDRSKLILNYQRAGNVRNKKADFYFKFICREMTERSQVLENPEGNFLEFDARNNYLYNEFKSKKIEKNFFQSIKSSSLPIHNKNKLINKPGICLPEDYLFNVCFNILSINISQDVVGEYKFVYNLLKNNGKFICAVPTETSLIELKEIFYELFPNFNSFMPSIRMVDIASIANNVGFKDIVIDKTELKLNVVYPKEIWSFIRSIGESNSHKNRNKHFINKKKYNKLCNIIEKKIIRNKLNIDISIYFFIGYKKL